MRDGVCQWTQTRNKHNLHFLQYQVSKQYLNKKNESRNKTISILLRNMVVNTKRNNFPMPKIVISFSSDNIIIFNKKNKLFQLAAIAHTVKSYYHSNKGQQKENRAHFAQQVSLLLKCYKNVKTYKRLSLTKFCHDGGGTHKPTLTLRSY